MSPKPAYLEASNYLAALDADWAGLIATVGPCELQATATREPYEALVRAIAYQQLHARAAEAILGRLIALYPDGAFPSPAALLATDPELQRRCGLSASKLATIRGIAQAALEGRVPDLASARQLSDEALIQQLVPLRGVGRWTVEMMLIFTLERPDVLPVDDYGVREGYRRLKGLKKAPTPRQLRDIGLAWHPHRSTAAWYLWRVPKTVGIQQQEAGGTPPPGPAG